MVIPRDAMSHLLQIGIWCLTDCLSSQFLLPLKVPLDILPASLLNNQRHGDEVFAVFKDKVSDEMGQWYLHRDTRACTHAHTHSSRVFKAIRKMLNFTERF